MPDNQYKVSGKVWNYLNGGSWVFVNVPLDESGQIKAIHGSRKKGFGSLRVSATIGETNWKTSIFPDTKSGCYLLPLKADVRKKESIEEGDVIDFTLEILT